MIHLCLDLYYIHYTLLVRPAHVCVSWKTFFLFLFVKRKNQSLFACNMWCFMNKHTFTVIIILCVCLVLVSVVKRYRIRHNSFFLYLLSSWKNDGCSVPNKHQLGWPNKHQLVWLHVKFEESVNQEFLFFSFFSFFYETFTFFK